MNKILKDLAGKVYQTLGAGFSEHIYSRALQLELRNSNIAFQDEVVLPVNYQGTQVGFVRADIMLFDSIIELKALVGEPKKADIVQLKNYLRILKLKTGYLINFPQAGANFSRNEIDFIEQNEDEN